MGYVQHRRPRRTIPTDRATSSYTGGPPHAWEYVFRSPIPVSARSRSEKAARSSTCASGAGCTGVARGAGGGGMSGGSMHIATDSGAGGTGGAFRIPSRSASTAKKKPILWAPVLSRSRIACLRACVTARALYTAVANASQSAPAQRFRLIARVTVAPSGARSPSSRRRPAHNRVTASRSESTGGGMMHNEGASAGGGMGSGATTTDMSQMGLSVEASSAIARSCRVLPPFHPEEAIPVHPPPPNGHVRPVSRVTSSSITHRPSHLKATYKVFATGSLPVTLSLWWTIGITYGDGKKPENLGCGYAIYVSRGDGRRNN